MAKISHKAEPTPDQVKTFLKHALKSRDMPPIDLNDAQQVKERADWYFHSCMEDGVKPGIEGLANAIGVSRRTLDRWASETARGPEHRDVVIEAKRILAELMEQYMLSGAIHPVAGIFLMSNTMDYERNAVPAAQVQVNLLTDGSDTQRIAQKYRADVIDVEANPAPKQISADLSRGEAVNLPRDEAVNLPSDLLPGSVTDHAMNWNRNFRSVMDRTRDKRLREELAKAEEAKEDKPFKTDDQSTTDEQSTTDNQKTE